MNVERQKKNLTSISNIRYDSRLESEIIARLIQEKGLMAETYGRISVDDFATAPAQEIYKVICDLYEQGLEWDIIGVRSTLLSKSNLKSLPSTFHDYLYGIIESYGLSSFKVLLQALKLNSVRSSSLMFLETTQNDLKEKDPALVINDVLSYFTNLNTTLNTENDWKFETTIKKHQELMELRRQGLTQGITTGFNQLDVSLGQGLQRKDLIVIGARPSVGKTSFALTVAYNAARKNHKVLFITLEMDNQEIMDKLLSFETKIPVTDIIRGTISNSQIFEEAYKSLLSLPLTIVHLPRGTSGDVYSVASKHKFSTGLDLLVVDYLGYLADEGDEEVSRLGQISRNLKVLSSLLDCSVLAPHQLNRKIEQRSENKRYPLLSDLRDSGHIEQDADVVMFLNRETLGENSIETQLRIGKNRTGDTAIIDLKFNKNTTRFEQI